MKTKGGDLHHGIKTKYKEHSETVRQTADDAFHKNFPRVRQKSIDIKRKVSGASVDDVRNAAVDAVEKAKTKLQDAAQDFQENQWPVIRQKSLETHAKYAPVVKEGLAQLCDSLAQAAARLCDHSPGSRVGSKEAAEAPETPAELPQVATQSSAEPSPDSTRDGNSRPQTAASPTKVKSVVSSPDKEASKPKQLDHLKPYGPGEFQRRKEVFQEGVSPASEGLCETKS